VSLNQDRGWEGGLTPLIIGDPTGVPHSTQRPQAALVLILKKFLAAVFGCWLGGQQAFRGSNLG